MVTRSLVISLFHHREITLIRKVGKSGHPLKTRIFHAALSSIISLQLANIIPAQNCRDFRFPAGLDLLYLSSSLSWNILLSQPLPHHRYTRSCASWHGIVKGSSYRFIPPSCDLSSMRFGPGRIQKPVTGPGARTGMFSVRETCSEEKGELDVPPWLNLKTALSTLRESRQNWSGKLSSVRLGKKSDQSRSRVGKLTKLPAL